MPEDFIKFGLIPEFIGRVPVVVTLDSLDEDALIRILKEPKNSLTKQYDKLFELDGVELEFQDEALESVARKSLERKTGARGLRSIMEHTLMDLMYRTPSDDTIRKCIITKRGSGGNRRSGDHPRGGPGSCEEGRTQNIPFKKERQAGNSLMKGMT